MAVIFSDLTAWVIRKLRALDGVTVTAEFPETITGPTLAVISDGGPRSRMIEDLRMRVLTFDHTREAAHDLARQADALLEAAPDGDPVVQVTRMAGPYEVGEPGALNWQVYQAFEIRARGYDQ